MKELMNRFEKRFSVVKYELPKKNLAFATVPQEQALPAITCLRDTEHFSHLVMISAVDYIEKNIFQITYLLHNYQTHQDMAVRVEIDRNNPTLESIHHLWATAHVYQRELKEMFGIDFPGSPDVNKPLMLEGWDDIPPLRRDFDTVGYVDKTFFPREGRVTFDPKEQMAKKLYPLESEVKDETRKRVRTNRDQ